MNLGCPTVQIHRTQQPIRTPRAPAVARLVASAHRKNCEEARSSGGPPRRIPPNFPVGLYWSRLEPSIGTVFLSLRVIAFPHQFGRFPVLGRGPQGRPEVATVISS